MAQKPAETDENALRAAMGLSPKPLRPTVRTRSAARTVTPPVPVQSLNYGPETTPEIRAEAARIRGEVGGGEVHGQVEPPAPTPAPTPVRISTQQISALNNLRESIGGWDPAKQMGLSADAVSKASNTLEQWRRALGLTEREFGYLLMAGSQEIYDQQDWIRNELYKDTWGDIPAPRMGSAWNILQPATNLPGRLRNYEGDLRSRLQSLEPMEVQTSSGPRRVVPGASGESLRSLGVSDTDIQRLQSAYEADPGKYELPDLDVRRYKEFLERFPEQESIADSAMPVYEPPGWEEKWIPSKAPPQPTAEEERLMSELEAASMPFGDLRPSKPPVVSDAE